MPLQEGPQQEPRFGLHRTTGDRLGIAHEGVADSVGSSDLAV